MLLGALSAVCGAAAPAKDWDVRAQKPKQESYWRTLRSSELPLVERVMPMPPDVRDFLNSINKLQGYSEVPSSTEPSAGYRADVRAALDTLPDAVKTLVAKKLEAVLLATDVGTTGMTDSVLDGGGRPVAAFTIIDVMRTDVTANAWATSKESSPFRPGGDETLTAEIEDPAGDTRVNAIQYILLHEFGHVLSVGEDEHPRWDARSISTTRPGDYPFFDLSWTVSAGGTPARRQADAFAGLPPIRFYHQESSTLPASRMKDVYERLEKTDFATLYGTTNPFDDFAEAFASYVHTVIMKRPYRIVIRKGGKTVKTYRACWDEPRCAAKRAKIEAFLAHGKLESP